MVTSILTHLLLLFVQALFSVICVKRNVCNLRKVGGRPLTQPDFQSRA